MSVEMKMRSVKPGFVVTAFGFFLFYGSNAVIARVHFGLSIGTTIGRCYPYSYRGCYPYPSCYGGYDSWWDRGWYRRFPRHPYWPRRSCSSRVGIWIHDSYPVVIDTPIVVRRHSIGSARGKTGVSAQEAAKEAQRREALRKKKSEQIKVLKIGDKTERIRAIRELAPFAYDKGIRRALEKILLSDPDPELRKEVAVLFGKTENQLVVAALRQAKEKDPVREVRQAAYRAIIMIEGY